MDAPLITLPLNTDLAIYSFKPIDLRASQTQQGQHSLILTLYSFTHGIVIARRHPVYAGSRRFRRGGRLHQRSDNVVV